MKEYVDSLYPLVLEKNKELTSFLAINKPGDIKFSKGTYYTLFFDNETRKQGLNIDDILSLYLIDISENVIVNFYKMVACLL
jgi:hypothetical protein